MNSIKNITNQQKTTLKNGKNDLPWLCVEGERVIIFYAAQRCRIFQVFQSEKCLIGADGTPIGRSH